MHSCCANQITASTTAYFARDTSPQFIFYNLDGFATVAQATLVGLDTTTVTMTSEEHPNAWTQHTQHKGTGTPP